MSESDNKTPSASSTSLAASSTQSQHNSELEAELEKESSELRRVDAQLAIATSSCLSAFYQVSCNLKAGYESF